MEDDDPTGIFVNVEISGSEQVDSLEEKLVSLIVANERVIRSFDGSAKSSDAVAKSLGELSRFVGQASNLSSLVAVFDKTADAASRLNKAANEFDIQKYVQAPGLIREALASEDIDQITAATAALERQVNTMRLRLQELKTITGQVDSSIIADLQEQLGVSERNLAEANTRYAILAEEARVERGVAGRQRSRTVAEAWAQTPTGRAEEAERQRSAQIALDYQQATAEQQARNAADRQRTSAESEDFQRDPVNIAAAKVSNATNQGAAMGILGADDESIDAIAQANIQRRQTAAAIKARQDELDPPEPKQSYWEQHTDKMFGNGGAGMFAFQAQLQAQYVLLNSVFEAYTNVQEAIVKFDNAMKEIAATSGASNAQLSTLRDTIIDVSTKTPFGAGQLAEVSKDLVTKGVSAGDVNSALPNIANLASATGSTLDQSAEIFSAAFENFKLRGAESASVADQFTIALNKTRLSAENFDQALQAVQETAKTNGLSLAETTAALGAMSQEGLRSGALLGTGLKQVLIDLEEPPKKLADRFKELGLSSTDLNVSTNSLVGVLDTLKEKGFTAADAFQVLSGRQAQAFAAALNGTKIMHDLYSEMLNGNGAAEANAIRMDSLENRFKQLGNTMIAIGLNATKPLVDALKVMGLEFTELTLGIDGTSKNAAILGTVIESLAGAALLRWLAGLITGFGTLTSVIKGVTIAFDAVATIVTLSEGAAAAVGTLLTGPVGLIALAAALYSGITLLGSYGEAQHAATAKAEELKDAVGKATDTLNDHAKGLDGVNGFLEQTVTKSGLLKKSQEALNDTIAEARNKFGDLSSAVYANITSYDALIAKLKQVQTEMLAKMALDLTAQQTALKAQNEQAGAQVKAGTSDSAILNMGRQLGLTNTNGGYGSNTIDTMVANSEGPEAPLIRQVMEAMRGIQNGQEGARRDLDAALIKINADGSPVSKSDQSIINASTASVLSGLMDQSESAGKLGINANTKKSIALQATPEYQAATDLQKGPTANLNTDLGYISKELSSDHSYNDQAASATVSIRDALAQIKAIEDGLAGKEGFDSTPIKSILDAAKAKIAEAQRTITDHVATQTVEGAKLVVTESQQTIEDITKNMGNEKKGERDELYSQLRAEIQRHYNLQVAQEKAETEAALKKNQDIDNMGQNQTIRLHTLQVERDRALAEAEHQFNAGGSTHSTHSPRPITQSLDSPGQTLALDLSQINTQASQALRTDENELKAAEAYLNTEKNTPGASKDDIKTRTQELAKLKEKVEGEQIADLEKTLTGLNSLYKGAEADLHATNASLDKLLAQYHVTVNADGTPNTGSLSGNDLTHFREEWDKLVKRVNELTSKANEIGNKIADDTGNLSTLQAEQSARNSVPAPNAANTFQNAVQDFNAKSGVGNGQNGMISLASETQIVTAALNKGSTAMADFFTQMETGSVKGAQAFKAFAASLIKDMLNIVNQKLAAVILGQLASAAGGLLGGGSSPSSGGGLGYSDPVASDGGVRAYHGHVFPHRKGNMPTHGGLGFNIKPRHVLHFQAGGLVAGPDIGRDSYQAVLAGGEAVLNSRATQLVGEHTINALNAGMISRAPNVPKAGGGPPVHQEVNVWVVQPGSQPPMGPKDVIATINEDIRNSGSTKKLIQQVMQGA